MKFDIPEGEGAVRIRSDGNSAGKDAMDWGEANESLPPRPDRAMLTVYLR